MKGILIDNIINSEYCDEPFKHNILTMFEKELCDKLVENFYSIKTYLKNFPLISSSRFMLKITGNTKNGIDCNDNYKIIQNLEPLNSVVKSYADNIIKLCYEKYNEPKDKINFCLNLCYDTENYNIGPHTDSFKRAVTVITYIVPKKDEGKKLGVSIYKDEINRHKDTWKVNHYTFDNFKKIKQLDYYSGSTLIFGVNKESFHGVEKIDVECDRMSIQAIVYKN